MSKKRNKLFQALGLFAGKTSKITRGKPKGRYPEEEESASYEAAEERREDVSARNDKKYPERSSREEINQERHYRNYDWFRTPGIHVIKSEANLIREILTNSWGKITGENESLPKDLETQNERFRNFLPEQATKASKILNDAIEQKIKDKLLNDIPPQYRDQKQTTAEYKDGKGGLLTQTQRPDGLYDFNTENNFTGTLRVERVDAKGNLLKDSVDIIEYKDGEVVSVVAGPEGNSRIGNFDKLMEQNIGIKVFTEQESGIKVATTAQEKTDAKSKELNFQDTLDKDTPTEEEEAAIKIQRAFREYKKEKEKIPTKPEPLQRESAQLIQRQERKPSSTSKETSDKLVYSSEFNKFMSSIKDIKYDQKALNERLDTFNKQQADEVVKYMNAFTAKKTLPEVNPRVQQAIYQILRDPKIVQGFTFQGKDKTISIPPSIKPALEQSKDEEKDMPNEEGKKQPPQNKSAVDWIASQAHYWTGGKIGWKEAEKTGAPGTQTPPSTPTNTTPNKKGRGERGPDRK